MPINVPSQQSQLSEEVKQWLLSFFAFEILLTVSLSSKKEKTSFLQLRFHQQSLGAEGRQGWFPKLVLQAVGAGSLGWGQQWQISVV